MTMKKVVAGVLAACLTVIGCAGPDGHESVRRQQSADSTSGPSPDLCGTWEAVELSVTTPTSSASATGNGVKELTDTHTFCRPISVPIPASIDVVGDPGQGLVTLTFGTPKGASTDAASMTTCHYQASNAQGAAPSYPFVSCTGGLTSGATVQAQTFSLSLRYHPNSASQTARVLLSNGPPPADAYRQYLGTTPNLAGVVLQVPASGLSPFSGVGLADGPPFESHAFVSAPPSGAFVVGPSVQVTGTGPLGAGTQLTVPFDTAWIATLPPGTLDTLAMQKVRQVFGGLAGIDATAVAGAAAASTTLTAGLTSPGTYLTTIRDLTPITYHGGPMMNAGVNVYFIWAGDFDAMAKDDPRPALRRFIADVPSSPWYGILSTYGITNTSLRIAGEVTRNDLTTLNDPYNDAVLPAIGSGGSLPTDDNGIYLVVAASNVTIADKNYCSVYCGYHAARTAASTWVKYGLIGSPLTCPGGCVVWNGSANGPNVDGVVTIVAHEIVETMTDPTGDGWHGASEISESYSSAVENADKCAWVFHSVQSTGNPPFYEDLASSGDYYFIQSNWVNAENGYCGMGVESVAISATPPAGGLAINQVGHFSVTVTNTGPVYMDQSEFAIIGTAVGLNAGESVPVPILPGLPPGQSATVDVPVQAPFQIDGNVQSVVFQFQVIDEGNDHTFGTIAQVSVDVRRANLLIDQAVCVSVAMPTSVDVGTPYPVTMTFQNTGTTIWLNGEYRLVGWPVDVLNPYLQQPQVLRENVAPGDLATLTFYASPPPGTYDQTITVTAGVANAAATFASACSGTTQVSNLGGPCTAGVGACAASGTIDAAGNCNAVPGTPDDGWHNTPDPVNNSWDWNCDGTIEPSERDCGTWVSVQNSCAPSPNYNGYALGCNACGMGDLWDSCSNYDSGAFCATLTDEFSCDANPPPGTTGTGSYRILDCGGTLGCGATFTFQECWWSTSKGACETGQANQGQILCQ